jgi:hypothetical protein
MRDSPDQAAQYHILVSKCGASSPTRHVGGHRAREFFVCVCVRACVWERILAEMEVQRVELPAQLRMEWHNLLNQSWQDGTVKNCAPYAYHIVLNSQWKKQRKMVTLQDNNNIIHLYFLWELLSPHCEHRSRVLFV